MLGLRTSYKEDMKASPAEMLYGTTLRVPGEFFVQQEPPADPQQFIEKHRSIMRELRPTPTAHHIAGRPFLLKDIYTCSHVFIRCDHVRAPLEPPYMGPYEVVERTTDRVFKINIDGTHKNISIDRLKPAHVSAEQPPMETPAVQKLHKSGHTEESNLAARQKSTKTVTFSTPLTNVTGGGVDLAVTPLRGDDTSRRHETGYCRDTKRQRKQTLFPREYLTSS
ncbi:hypothetical protein KPH14_002685 [Odynerus spinipes]|uniref:Uncharacterized protein n=1 Tax=Odynerus spinipes TaxID=1348599 RepID=A0AAD9VHW6_9HYME|nr:hypothetical protein KPH14_002685 [Odynerus spinipes]